MNREDKENGIPREGKILHAVNRFTAGCYHKFVSGFFGFLFCTRSAGHDESIRNGLGGKLRRRTSGLGNVAKRVGKRVAYRMEQSRVLALWRIVFRKLMECPVNVFGMMFALYGCYSLVMCSVTGNSDGLTVLSGILFIVVAVPLLFSGASLARSVGKSRLMHWFMTAICGVSEESFDVAPVSSGLKYVAAACFSVVTGLFTFWLHPLIIPAVCVALIAVIMVLYQPELGAVITLFSCPFFLFSSHSTMLLCICVGITAFGYLAKLISGRRMFYFGLMDGMVGLLSLLYLFGGIFTFGGLLSFRSAVGYCVMIAGGYFLLNNLAWTPVWKNRCLVAIVTSSTVVSAIGLSQYLMQSLTSGGVLSDVGVRMTSVFSASNMLGEYLVLILPLAVVFAVTEERLIKSFFLWLCAILIGCCIILTWSRGAWIGMLVALFLMLFVGSYKTFTAMILGTLPVAGFAVNLSAVTVTNPVVSGVLTRFASIANPLETSTLSRVYTWNGVRKMLGDYLWTGIGVGESAFREVYPMYAVSGLEAAAHAQSLYFQILSDIGIVGLIVFVLCIWLLLRRSLGFIAETRDRYARLVSIAGVAAIFGVMVTGIVDYVWYNYSVCFLFWAVIGLCFSNIRIGYESAGRTEIPFGDAPNEAETVIAVFGDEIAASAGQTKQKGVKNHG